MVAAIVVGVAAGVVVASPAAAAVPAGNLVGDPGAEQGTAAQNDTTVAAPPSPWTTGFGSPSQVAYGAPGGFPTVGDANGIAGQTAFFAGGPSTSTSLIKQTINLTSSATEIDAGHIQATVSAALGGYADQNDTAKVNFFFKATTNAGDDGLGAVTLGPVTRSDRGDQTKLLVRDAVLTVPAGTRFVFVEVVTNRDASAAPGQYDDGYADNISLTLRDTSVLPTNVTKPGMFGTPKPGSTLTCSQGTWTANPTSYDFFWDRAPRGTTADSDPAWGAIDGAAQAVYIVQQADVGSRVRCRVIAHNGAGTGTGVSRSLRVDLAAPVNSMAPQVVGTPISQTDPLTCKPGEWSAGPDFAYQWLRDGQPISGATDSTYTPTPTFNANGPNFVNGDGNHQISCQVTATNDLGSSSPATSAGVLVVDGSRLTSASTSISPARSRPGERQAATRASGPTITPRSERRPTGTSTSGCVRTRRSPAPRRAPTRPRSTISAGAWPAGSPTRTRRDRGAQAPTASSSRFPPGSRTERSTGRAAAWTEGTGTTRST